MRRQLSEIVSSMGMIIIYHGAYAIICRRGIHLRFIFNFFTLGLFRLSFLFLALLELALL